MTVRSGIVFFLLAALAAGTAQPRRAADLAGVQADFAVWGKQASTSGYGLGVAVAVGDLNGDGVDDLIVGDHDATTLGQARSGAVYVFFGDPNRPRGRVDLAAQQADLVVGGTPLGTHLGRSVAVADFNGDGVDDLITGAPFVQRPGISSPGAVYVFYGRRTWGTFVSAANANVTVRGGKYGTLGFSVAGGDLNGDGLADLLMGAPEVAAGGSRTRVGEAYALFMPKPAPAQWTVDLATTTPQITLTGRDYGDRLGISVASGDPNGDGLADFLVGSPMARPGGRANAGEVYVLWGRKNWSVPLKIDLANTQGPRPDLVIQGKNYYDRLSWTIATGDLNGDGIEDILTGAHRADPWNPFRAEGGMAYLFLGSRNFPPNHVIDLTRTPAYVTFWGRGANDQLGFGCAVADLDHDGRQDVLLSAPRYDYAGRQDCGAVFVFRGPLRNPTTLDLARTAADWEIYGPAGGAYLGGGAARLTDEYRSALAVGDFNGDRIADLAMGAPRLSPLGRPGAGGAYVLYGGFTYLLDAPRIGTTVRVQIQAPAYPNTFRLGAAAFGGEIGIPIDTRIFPLNADVLFFFSLVTPTIFQNYRGWIDARGEALAQINVLNDPALVGVTIFTAFVLLDQQAPSGAAAVGNRVPVTFQN